MIKVLCGGRFNFLHKGHEYFLKKAKEHGDCLVVVIAHDLHNLKKQQRKQTEQRKQQIESLGIADKVLIGDPEDFFKVVVKEKPQVIALGWDQKLPFPKAKLNGLGIKTVKIEKFDK
ncbi:MAG TPA: adenylyltransferase/cytidyltransferase family protein [archaeon]|nr:adenylyltransferase/cytidyltransferase family protein [archaeon]